MNTTPLIALSGKIGSGKDTVANIMTDVFHVYHGQYSETRRFAAKLKQFVADITGCPVQKLDDQDFKKSFLGPEWNYFEKMILNDEHPLYDNTLPAFNEADFPPGTMGPHQMTKLTRMTVREMLIRIGDGMRNVVHTDIWVNGLMSDWKGQAPWIIADMRYMNEKSRVEYLAGYTIRINRDECQRIDHISETGLDNEQFSYVINNNGSLEELAEQVKSIVYDIKRIKGVY